MIVVSGVCWNRSELVASVGIETQRTPTGRKLPVNKKQNKQEKKE
jgi:hypothetical protein